MRFAGDSGKVKFGVICGGKPGALERLWKFYGVTGELLNGVEGSEEPRSLDDMCIGSDQDNAETMRFV